MGYALQSLLGVVLIPLAAWALSEDRMALGPLQAVRLVGIALAVQGAIALVLLGLPASRVLFEAAAGLVRALQAATDRGMQMVFGYLAGSPAPFEVRHPGNTFILAMRGLPLILVMSALTRLLYHWGVLQVVVRGIARLLQKSLGLSGPLGTAVAAKLFLGMIEAPLLVRPYLRQLGRGALFAVMVAGMATIAGTVMALYAQILSPVLPDAAGHVVAASVMNLPAALVLARLAVPAGFADGPRDAAITLDNAPQSSLDAIAQGTADGLKLLAYVAAMLIAMVALVALANSALGLLTGWTGWTVTLEGILGWLCAPVAFLIGIPWGEAQMAGALIGKKVVLNELLAYLDMAALPHGALSVRSRTILTYALCGFANLGSLGILIGGLSAMVPERRADIVALGWKAMLVGVLATLLSAAVVGVVVRA